MPKLVINPFQLTRSRGARLGHREDGTITSKFQLTRSRGARLKGIIDELYKYKFQLTRSRGARLAAPEKTSFMSSQFQLTRSRGARPICNFMHFHIRINFNSRAHVERD